MGKQVKEKFFGVKLNVDGGLIELSKKTSASECQRLSEKKNCSGFFEDKPELKQKKLTDGKDKEN